MAQRIFDFRFPDLGEGVHEGEIVRWLVAEGDRVVADQPVVEVMTDKITTVLPIPVPGTVHCLRCREQDIVTVGSVLIQVTTDVPVPGAPGPGKPAKPGLEAPAAAGTAETPVRALPVARRLARELGVDLAALQGTGPGGTITEADVRAGAARPAAPRTSPAPGETDVRRIRLRGRRRIIAEHVARAHQATVPFTLVREVDFTALTDVRAELKAGAWGEEVPLTYLPFIVGAVSTALRSHPHFNARWDEASGDLLVSPRHQIGIAVETPDGLLVPVIADVHLRDLRSLAAEIHRLILAARSATLRPEEIHGGTFTVSNVGPAGGLLGTPVLNTPEIGIMSIHSIAPRPAVFQGELCIRTTGHLCVTMDHRYVDGAEAGTFLERIACLLEDPAALLAALPGGPG